MNQALYAHMNNKRKMKKKKENLTPVVKNKSLSTNFRNGKRIPD
jgi:hypothetical protein